MADILFVHNNFPAQLGFVAEALVKRGHRCAAIGSQTAQGVPGVGLCKWRLQRGTAPGIFDIATRAEADLMRGRAAADCGFKYREAGFNPRIIIGHPGWGETTLLKEVWPEARVILHGEFYYRSTGADVGFDDEFGQQTQEERFRVHAKNATLAMAYAEADRIVCPTPFQQSLFPAAFRDRSVVIHEGLDTRAIKPRAGATFELEGRTFRQGDPVVTYINRHMEPLRGIHVFLRSLPTLFDQNADARAILIGNPTSAGYGASTGDQRTWAQRFMDELGDRLDRSRVHFLGRVPHDRMLNALQVSAAHVYWTYPFVLSWSLLEAMASGCAVFASDTAPVRDVVQDGVNGRLLPFFEPQTLGEALAEACRDGDRYAPMRQAARRTGESYDRSQRCLPAWMNLVDEVLAA